MLASPKRPPPVEDEAPKRLLPLLADDKFPNKPPPVDAVGALEESNADDDADELVLLPCMAPTDAANDNPPLDEDSEEPTEPDDEEAPKRPPSEAEVDGAPNIEPPPSPKMEPDEPPKEEPNEAPKAETAAAAGGGVEDGVTAGTDA